MSAGHVVHRLPIGGVRARVEAVFENSFYLKAQENWLCLAGPSLAMGPLTLRCDVPEKTDWRATGIHVGMAARVGGASIHLHPSFVLSLADTSEWTPPATPEWTPASLSRGVGFVETWVSGRADCEEGLGEFILPRPSAGSRSAVAQRASDSVGCLRHWLASGMAGSNKLPNNFSAKIEELTGLGPGLTPSGDDFLGGAMIGLRAVDRIDLSQGLFGIVGEKVARHSNSISAAHLAAAAEGAGSEWLHLALNDILAGDAKLLPMALTNVGRMGHTSGWDALAGALTVFREFLAAKQPGHRSYRLLGRNASGNLLALRQAQRQLRAPSRPRGMPPLCAS